MIEVLALLVLVVGGLVVALFWARGLGELLWLLAMRPRVVLAAMVLYFCLVVFIGHLVLKLPYSSPTLWCIGYIAIPLTGGRIADLAAWLRECGGLHDILVEGDQLPKIKGFIFARYLTRQDANYEAPQVVQVTFDD